jgi:hypothetical protein
MVCSFWIFCPKFLGISCLFHTCYMTCPSYPPRLYHPTNLLWREQTMKLLSLSNFLQPPNTSSLLGQNIQCPVFTPNLCSSIIWETKYFTPIKQQAKLFVHFNRYMGQDFSLLHRVQTSSGVHPASYPMGTGSSFPGGKAARTWGWPLISIQCWGQEWWSYTSTPPYVFTA